MNKGWIQLLSVIAAIAFICVNLFLIEKEESKADRINYISSWKPLQTGNLIESFPAEGIIVPSEKHRIFIDKNAEFQEFLVEKGDKVESGTPLFEYASDHLDGQTALLDAEIDSLTEQKDSIDTFIENMEKMKSSLSPIHISYVEDDWGYEYDNDYDYDSDYVPDYHTETDREADIAREKRQEAAAIRELKLSLDRAIAEKELEKEKVDQEIQKYEDQREAIESGRSGLTVIASVDGIVEDISFELDNPVMTIVSEDPIVEGRLLEEQIAKVEEGMQVNITSNMFKGQIIGDISKVDELPISDPSIDQASLYQFTATLGDHDKDLYVGYHVKTDIVTATAMKVPVLHEKSILQETGKDYMWVLTDQGVVRKRKIGTGLKVGKRVEVTSGGKLGEYYVVDQQEVQGQAPFITPFKVNKSLVETWNETNSRKKLKYILIGVLQR
ncbi:efflux RND transporter periplasmic adaptor subunit [Lederbergia citrea]|uniref:efflux RND transporter periplasmic adaptor subunit n=1 Tax=Lederbergia citrea TaxID=2833581 RepID=UPI001BC9DC1E|nr:HlyD family efflux transporter periplasmic adaptor subunit [Lederbergia citrea]